MWGLVPARTRQHLGKPSPHTLSLFLCSPLRMSLPGTSWLLPFRESWISGYAHAVPAIHIPFPQKSIWDNSEKSQRKRKCQVTQAILWPLQGRRSGCGTDRNTQKLFQMINARIKDERRLGIYLLKNITELGIRILDFLCVPLKLDAFSDCETSLDLSRLFHPNTQRSEYLIFEVSPSRDILGSLSRGTNDPW